MDMMSYAPQSCWQFYDYKKNLFPFSRECIKRMPENERHALHLGPQTPVSILLSEHKHISCGFMCGASSRYTDTQMHRYMSDMAAVASASLWSAEPNRTEPKLKLKLISKENRTEKDNCRKECNIWQTVSGGRAWTRGSRFEPRPYGPTDGTDNSRQRVFLQSHSRLGTETESQSRTETQSSVSRHGFVMISFILCCL